MESSTLTDVQNGNLEYNWAIKPTALWTNRFSIDRVHAPGHKQSLSDVERCGPAGHFEPERIGPDARHQRGRLFPLHVHPVLRGHGFRAHSVQLLFGAAVGERAAFDQVRRRAAAFLQQLLAAGQSHGHFQFHAGRDHPESQCRPGRQQSGQSFCDLAGWFSLTRGLQPAHRSVGGG